MLDTLPSSDFLGTVNWWPSSSRGASGGSSANCADAGGPSSCKLQRTAGIVDLRSVVEI